MGPPGKEAVPPHVRGTFAKSDQAWLEPMLAAIAKNAGRLLSGDDNGFMNKITLATQPDEPTKPEPKPQSHIRQARPTKPQVAIPETGPMAAILKKLFKGD